MMAAQTADNFQKINCTHTKIKHVVDTLANIYIVNQLETQKPPSNGHVGLASAKTENDDSDEEKDEDGGNMEAEAPGGWLASLFCWERWLTIRSRKEEEKEETQEEEGGSQWQQNADRAPKSSCLGSLSRWPVS